MGKIITAAEKPTEEVIKTNDLTNIMVNVGGVDPLKLDYGELFGFPEMETEDDLFVYVKTVTGLQSYPNLNITGTLTFLFKTKEMYNTIKNKCMKPQIVTLVNKDGNTEIYKACQTKNFKQSTYYSQLDGDSVEKIQYKLILQFAGRGTAQ